MQSKYFESQQDDEQVLLLIRRHYMAILPVIAIATFVYIIGFLTVFVLPFAVPALVSGYAYHIYVLLTSILFLFNTIFLFNNWVLHYLHVAILTTEHFVEINQEGLFSRKISEMTLERVQDVSASQKGLIHTMFNLGEVEVQTAGEAPNFVIHYVPDPNGVSQKIMEAEETFCKMNGLRNPGPIDNANVNSEPKIEYPGV